MNISQLPRFTIEEFQNNFDELFERVEKNKETFIIVDVNGKEFIITPYDEELENMLEDDKDITHG